jgi:hypothetical protein
MRAIRLSKLVCLTVCEALFAAAAWAGVTPAESSAATAKNANPTNPPPISVAVKFEGGPGQIPTSRAYITVGTNKFAFLLPGGFRLSQSDAQKVAMVKDDGSCVISLKVISLTPAAIKSFDGAAARALLAEEHPDGTITTEFGMSAANISGPAFEVVWGAGPLARASRIGFVPLRAGVIEFSVDASPKNLTPSLGDLNYVVLTFRASDENGKLEATPLSDKL